MNHLEENKETEYFDNRGPQVILKQDLLGGNGRFDRKDFRI